MTKSNQKVSWWERNSEMVGRVSVVLFLGAIILAIAFDLGRGSVKEEYSVAIAKWDMEHPTPEPAQLPRPDGKFYTVDCAHIESSDANIMDNVTAGRIWVQENVINPSSSLKRSHILLSANVPGGEDNPYIEIVDQKGRAMYIDSRGIHKGEHPL